MNIIASLVISAGVEPMEGYMNSLNISMETLGQPSVSIQNASCPRIHDLWHALTGVGFSYAEESIVARLQSEADFTSSCYEVPSGWEYYGVDATHTEDLLSLASLGLDAYDFYRWCRNFSELEFYGDEMLAALPVRVDCTNTKVTVTKL